MKKKILLACLLAMLVSLACAANAMASSADSCPCGAGYYYTDIYSSATCVSGAKVADFCLGCGKAYDIRESGGAVNPDNHKITSEVTFKGDCLSGEVTTYTCSYGCGKSYTEVTDTSMVTGSHSFQWVTMVEANCETNGFETQVCTVCGAEGETNHFDLTDHSWVKGYEEEATCTEPGMITWSCTVCFNWYEEDIEPKGHSYGSEVVVQEPTCTINGLNQKTCSVCGYVQDVITEGGPCNYVSYTVKCNGYQSRGYDCQRCTGCLTEKEKVAHSATTKVYNKQTTCTTDGSYHLICAECNNNLTYSRTETATGHSYNNKVYADPTCGAKGSTMYYCTNSGCTFYYVEEDIPATNNHTWGAWQTETAATCSKAGLEKHSCTVCGKTETQSIAATNEHSWSEWKTITEPTATTDGEAERVCTTCGAEQTKELKSTGNGSDDDDDDDDDDDSDDDYPIPAPPIDPNHTHVPVTQKGFPATCEDWGREDGTGCAICGKFISGNWIAPLGHTPVTVPGYPATETEKGLSDGIKCAVCGKMLLGQYPVDINGTYYDPENPDQPIDPPVYPPVEIEGELEPGHPNFDLDKYLDEYYEHVEDGDEIRPTIDSDKCIIGTTVKLEGDNITVLIKGAEDYAICPIDKYPMSQWIDLGNGTHKRICTCIDCDYYEIAACTYFTIVVDEAEYKICPICGHFTEKSYEWIKGVKVGGVGDMNELIARDITAPFGTAAVQVKDMSAEPTVIASSFTAVKSTKGVLNSWTNEETLYIPMENPGDVTLAQMNMDGEFAAVPFAWENGYVIFNADEHGLYLFVK